jgi:hypothetical protein
LAALTRRLDAEDAKTQQSGPDSMTTRLLGMSVSPAFVFGSTAPPVALDANGLAKSQVSETDTEPPPAQREPAKPAARSKPATRSNAAAAWLFGLAALAGIGVATMMQREKLQEAEVAAAGVPPLVQEQRQKDPEPVADPVSNLVLPPPVVSSATDTKNEPQHPVHRRCLGRVP